jgi:hypothetical protein
MPNDGPCWLKQMVGGIDIDIDARRLAKAGASLSLVRLMPNSSPDLRDLLVPWFKRDGIPVIHLPERVNRRLYPYTHERKPEYGDHTLSIGEVAAQEHPHPWFKPGSIMTNPPLTGCYPAYAVGSRYLLLDGNHHCISLVRSNADYAVDLVVIRGPADRLIMADLAAFETTQEARGDP